MSVGLMSLPREELSPVHLQVDADQATPRQDVNSSKNTWLFRVGLGFVCLALIAVSAWAVIPLPSHFDSLPGSEDRSRHTPALAFLPTMPALNGRGFHPYPSRVMTPRTGAFGANPSRAVIPQAGGFRPNRGRAVIHMSAAATEQSGTFADLLELPVPKIAEKLSLGANKYAVATGFEDLVLASSDTAKIIDKACAYAAPAMEPDRILGSKDINVQRALESVYKALAARNILRGFGSCSNVLIPLENKLNFNASDQERVTGVSPTAWAPPRSRGKILSRLTTVAALAYGYAGFSWLPILAGVALDNLVFKGSLGETIKRTVTPGFNEMVLEREAGRFLVAYLLGNPVQACSLDSWAALKARDFSQRLGTVYFDPELGQKYGVQPGELSLTRACVDRSSTVMMSGIAADAMNGKSSELSFADETFLRQLLSELNDDSWDMVRIQSQARWGAVQAYLLLRNHESAYRALCKALSEGSSIGEAVMVIEGALAQDADLPAQKRKQAQLLVADVENPTQEKEAVDIMFEAEREAVDPARLEAIQALDEEVKRRWSAVDANDGVRWRSKLKREDAMLYDTNKDGKLSMDEIDAAAGSLLEEDNAAKEELRRAFKEVDTDNDGLISIKDFEKLMDITDATPTPPHIDS